MTKLSGKTRRLLSNYGKSLDEFASRRALGVSEEEYTALAAAKENALRKLRKHLSKLESAKE